MVLEASPYHGTSADRDGTRILPDPKVGGGKSIGLTGFFAPRGYAVAMMDLRGTGKSGGCLDHLGPRTPATSRRSSSSSRKADWSNGSVGMVGHSYVGSTPMVAAAQNPVGLKTIVPSAGLATHVRPPVPGAACPTTCSTPGRSSPTSSLALQRHLPPGVPVPTGGATGDDFARNVPNTGCGLPQSAATAGYGQVTGQYQAWHAAARPRSRRHRRRRSRPSSCTASTTTPPASPAADWFMDRGGRAGDKAWIGQWDHGSGFAPNRRGMQWPFALLGWFDKQLKGRGRRHRAGGRGLPQRRRDARRRHHDRPGPDAPGEPATPSRRPR